MDEESMWKGIYEKLQEEKTQQQTEHENEIQEIDGSFFEKFGSLLRQHSAQTALDEVTPLAPMPEEHPVIPEEEASEIETAVPDQPETEEVPAEDSGVETLVEPDSEPEEIDQAAFIEDAMGWNIDELYEEILFAILHNVGCDVSLDICQTALFSYIQDAFKMPNDKHETILAAAEAKEAPEIRLNVEVIEAKDLMPKDANGLSDPFVTMYLLSAPSHRYNTSVKSATLSPFWEEHFSLPLSDKPGEDTLCLEVWDFDPAETVREKMGKIFEVKGVRGLRKLMKEIAITASTGKHDNELVGRAQIPLKTIPASGMTMWCSLDKRNKLKRQGVVKVRMGYSAEKNGQVAAQEHRHLLRVLLLHELEHSKVTAYWWCGNFSAQADAILTQHSAQSGLSLTDTALAQWSVYCQVHVEHPLAFGLFVNILDKLVKPLQNGSISKDEIKSFWEATKKLLPSCFSIIRKIRKRTAGDKGALKALSEVLRILHNISALEQPEGIDLFPKNVYGWLNREDDTKCSDFQWALEGAVRSGSADWFAHILENNECTDNSHDGALQHLVRIIQLVRSDLQRAVEYYDRTFQEAMNFQYARCLYTVYESSLSGLIEPEVARVCRGLRRIDYTEAGAGTTPLAPMPGTEPASTEPLAMGTALFELYLVMKRFVVLGVGLCPGEADTFAIRDYHQWFYPGVAHWLDIAVYKALTRIEKAVELDQLMPVDNTVKYSSSAVDSLAIFYQIKIFWEQLAWPDIEGCYTFVAKIIDDICRCCIFYADKMSERVDGAGDQSDAQASAQSVFDSRFEVTNEWCLAINNIDYIRQSLQPFVTELGMEDIIKRLSDFRSPMEAARCRETLVNVIENAADTERNKILELVETLAKKMAPAMKRFLMEGAELLHQDSNSLDRLMLYLENSLATLNQNLNADNFERVLASIWAELAGILYDLVQNSLEKRRPPSFFANLRDTLNIMVNSFKLQSNTESSSEETDTDVLKDIDRILTLHGYETADLIHQYHLERFQEQTQMTESPLGLLTVRCFLEDTMLNIEIMNARNLLPQDSNGSCDSFIRVHLLPEERFAGVIKPKTQTHHKNLYPLFDEVFSIPLTSSHLAKDDALIYFCVKDKDFLGMSNQYMCEAFLRVSELPRRRVEDQTHLKLSRPCKLDTDSIKALEHRQGDKQARDFLKKLKQKMGVPH